MGWSIGYDDNRKRDIGYGVPSICDHPGCGKEIDRGLSYVCGGQPFGGEYGCGLYFCSDHRYPDGRDFQCERCRDGKEPFDPTPDTLEWVRWKLTDESWKQWREEHPDEVSALNEKVSGVGNRQVHHLTENERSALDRALLRSVRIVKRRVPST